MLRKNQRTFEKYMQAGAMMRLCKDVMARTIVCVSDVVPLNDMIKMDKANRLIQEVCSTADSNMFRDYPELRQPNAYTGIFYGAMNVERENDVNKQVVATAHEEVEKLFGQKERT